MRNRKHDIEKYLRGELSPSEMHALEKEALSDPFLAEALEGIEHAGTDDFLYDLHQINRSVHDRMRRKSRKNNRTIRIWGWTSAVAATILLTAVSGFLVVQILKDQQGSEPLTNRSEENQQETAGADSLDVNRGDSSLLALEKASEATVPSQPGNNPAEAQARKRAPAVSETATEPLADASHEKNDISQQPVTSDQGADDSEEEVARSNAQEQILAQAETSGQDSIIRAIPSSDQAVSRALKGKAAGAQTRREEPARYPDATDRNSKTVRGKVTSEDGHGLPGVNIIIEGTSHSTVTDVEGNYELDVPENSQLVFSFIGFETQAVAADKSEIDITLEEDISTLSEVVVTSYSGEKTADDPSSFRFAEPDGGKNDFKTYLANTVKYPQEAIKNKTQGKVTVRFTVEPNGRLTDFEVVKGIGSGCEEELIRAIQKGPYWKPSTRGDQPVKDKVRVRFKFNLPK